MGTAQIKPEKEFYTYVYLREDATPYYVGKGQRKRIFEKHRHHGVPPKNRAQIIYVQMTNEQDALEYEKQLIVGLGRKDLGTGCLRNMTDGGDNPPSQKGIPRSESTRLKMSVARLGRKLSLEQRAKMSVSAVGRKHSPETRMKMLGSKNFLNHKHSLESRAKISAANLGRKCSPEARAKMSATRLKNGTGRGNKYRLGCKHTEEWKQTAQKRMLGNIVGNLGRCTRWNIQRGKPCICGQHLDVVAQKQ